jgi:hypothetical protein
MKTARRKVTASLDDLQTALLLTVHGEWPSDRTRPGVVTSYLARNGQFYASIMRYKETGPFANNHEKFVVLSRKASSLRLALILLSRDFIGMQSSRSKLREMLG